MHDETVHPSNSAPSSAPAPEDSVGPLSPLRERFCRYYLTEPSATRAAVKAGYSERTAGRQAHRLLKNVEILQRIDAIRRSEHLVYELTPQAVMDRCEAIFEEALEKGRYEAAIGALRLQAKIGGLLKPDAPGVAKQDLSGMVEYCVRTAVAQYVFHGTIGALNPLKPPPWAPGEEAARRKRRNMEKERGADAAHARADADADRAAALAEIQQDADARTRDGWPPRTGTLIWPHEEAALYRAAVGHDDDHNRAEDRPPMTIELSESAPADLKAQRERGYAAGRASEPGAVERGFPPEDDDQETS